MLLASIEGIAMTIRAVLDDPTQTTELEGTTHTVGVSFFDGDTPYDAGACFYRVNDLYGGTTPIPWTVNTFSGNTTTIAITNTIQNPVIREERRQIVIATTDGVVLCEAQWKVQRVAGAANGFPAYTPEGAALTEEGGYVLLE